MVRMRSTRDLAARAAERREELGLSQAQLADRARVTRDWVARFESGRQNVTLIRVLDVYRALGLTIESREEHEEHEESAP